jgi:hypothetical protein
MALNKLINFFKGHITWGSDSTTNIGVDTRTTNNLGDGMRPRNIFAGGLIASGNLYGLNPPYGVNGPASIVGGIVAAGQIANCVAFLGASTLLDGVGQGFIGFSKDTSTINMPGFFNSSSASDFDIFFAVGHRFAPRTDLMKFGADGSLSLLSSGALLNFAQITTPTTPAAGTNDLYFKSDDNLYAKNSAGVEVRIGGSESATWTKHTVTFSDLAAASTTNSITLFAANAKTVITGVIIKHSASFTGGSLASYTVSVGQSGSNAQFASAFDVFQAASNTAFQSSDEQQITDFASTINVTVTATSTGGNLNAATQGSVDIWVLSGTLP